MLVLFLDYWVRTVQQLHSLHYRSTTDALGLINDHNRVTDLLTHIPQHKGHSGSFVSPCLSQVQLSDKLESREAMVT